MRNFVRGFVAIWYLLGWLSHVYLGIVLPETYTAFGKTALIPGFAELWSEFVMPSITFFALLLAVFEVTTGLLIINKGKWVKIGLAFSILFNLFLIQMGLGYLAANGLTGFAVNRLPNLIFLALQIPLLWGWDEATLAQVIGRRFSRPKAK